MHAPGANSNRNLHEFTGNIRYVYLITAQ
uniref:Uncharacterized protein n=1 Tax=Anguilla anguilla TaxID=7936 RepID=A0A0E9SKL7_ANGAN